MIRTLTPPQTKSDGQLMQVFALMAFCAQDNLRNVAKALAASDLATLDLAYERNKKISRLRGEIEEQVKQSLALPGLIPREKRKLALTIQLSTALELMGNQTVEVADLSKRLIQQSKPVSLRDLKKLIEQTVYMTDKVNTAFIEEKSSLAHAALKQGQEASLLFNQMNQHMMSTGQNDASFSYLRGIAKIIKEISENSSHSAQDVLVFIQTS